MYPDANASYWIDQFELPLGAKLTLHGRFPFCRYMSYALYRPDPLGSFTAAAFRRGGAVSRLKQQQVASLALISFGLGPSGSDGVLRLEYRSEDQSPELDERHLGGDDRQHGKARCSEELYHRAAVDGNESQCLRRFHGGVQIRDRGWIR